MKTHRCEDWSHLAGAEVAIHRHGRLLRVGVVDAVMPNDNVLWLASDYNGHRTIFESAEGYEAWVDPKDVPEP